MPGIMGKTNKKVKKVKERLKKSIRSISMKKKTVESLGEACHTVGFQKKNETSNPWFILEMPSGWLRYGGSSIQA